MTGRLFYCILETIEDSDIRFYTFAACVGNVVHIRGWDDSLGGHFIDKIRYKPTLYVLSSKPTEYQTLDGKHVTPVNPGWIKDCRQFIEDYKDVKGTEVFGMERFLYQYLSDEYQEEIVYDKDKLKICSLDIETTAENGFPKPDLAEEEVLLITMKNFRTKQIITFGSRPYEVTRDDVNYIQCADEADLLSTFVEWWDDVQPEIITGWNVELFDMTYLCNRISKICGQKKMKRLSPWRIVDQKIIERNRSKAM